MYTDINSPVAISVIANPVQLEQTSFTNHTENQFIAIISISAKGLSTFFTINNATNKPARLLATILNQANLESFATAFFLQGITMSSKEYFQGPILNQPPSLNTNTQSGCVTYSECNQIGGNFLNLEGAMTCIMCRPNS